MNEFDIPIFIKSFDLYKKVYEFRKIVSKQDRYTIWQKLENLILKFLESILLATQTSKPQKLVILEKASQNLNMIRVFLRLTKDVRALDNKRCILLQEQVNQIGKMLGGWIKSAKGF